MGSVSFFIKELSRQTTFRSCENQRFVLVKIWPLRRMIGCLPQELLPQGCPQKPDAFGQPPSSCALDRSPKLLMVLQWSIHVTQSLRFSAALLSSADRKRMTTNFTPSGRDKWRLRSKLFWNNAVATFESSSRHADCFRKAQNPHHRLLSFNYKIGG